jgi:hypothetical protein
MTRRPRLGTDATKRVYCVGNLLFRRSADAVEYACKNGQKVIKVFMRPDRAALNLNRVPTIPALLSEFMKTNLEHVATYKQNGNSAVYFAEFRAPEMAETISF